MELFISQLHFIRPEWFFAFIPLLLITFVLLRVNKQGRSWTNIIDPKLLPHLLIGQSVKKTSIHSLLVFIAGTLAIFALAGPAWEKRPQPVFKDKSALVIALDLSSSMDAADIKPSRLTRAKHKITDILKQRKLGQTALLVYAGSSFVVTPLTDDTATISSLLESLTTDIMPAQGTRTDKALLLASSLLKNADVRQGDILLVTDSIEKQSKDTFEKISKQHRISILAVATAQGGPIPLPSGGFLKDRGGNIIVPKLDISNFRDFSNIGNGRLTTLSASDTDIKTISALLDQSHINKGDNTSKTNLKTDSWYEQGAWLLLLLLPIAALAFRRGAIFLFVFVIIQQPQYLEASTFWDSLWKNADQRASEQLKNNNPEEAAKTFNNKEWKAASYYKNKQYQETIDTLKDINTANAHYNSGNAYAKLGQIDKAIEKYKKSIQLNPKHEDAIYNKQLLENQKNQQKENNKQDSKNNKNQKNKDQDKKGDDKKKSKSENKDNSEDKGNKQSQDEQSKQEEKNKESSKKKKQEEAKKREADKNKSEEEKAADKKENEKKEKDKQDQQQKAKKQQATKQWLRRIPDDPGGLLRNKFNYQYKRQNDQKSEKDNW